MKALKKLFVAALALSLPLATLAQATEAAKPAEAAPAAAPAPAAKPAEETIKVTPYGFVLLNAYWDGNTLVNKDYPGQAARAGTNEGGAFLMSARQSRVGMRLATSGDNWTGAALTGVIEFDFKAGHVGVAPQASTTWYNGLMRLRLAAMTATWKTPYGNWAVLAGQEYGLVNPLFAESLAWVADPLFWQAGNLWRRSPQIRLSYNGQFDMVGLSLAAAMLSPADAGQPVDNGYGNRSRTPNFEARGAVSVKAAPDISGTVGVGYHMQTRRYNYGTPDQKDVDGYMLGVDADLNLTQFLQVKGEYYTGKGADDTYNTIGAPTVQTDPPYAKVKGDGYWAQGIIKPLPQLWLTIGYGKAKMDDGDLGFVAAANQAATRFENTQLAGGVLVNAGKFWRFGVEAMQVETKYLVGADQKATQIALSSQLKF
ncbi:hypothetical protein [Anaeromyxobacter dehalogenans]|uniref:Porin n=1 Tax=Anaeromyxobacter dehalogenans (strain 2CP-C) TaxID=290397 RepID=Q2IKL0_ANADE|nr:hypothetical protein [Anaeromyxobacter dehalogenans]ABC82193.1 hypothetical protein Adeh_2423 [Anaeromyxobacter dehalogenans 2CP-C]